MNTCELCNRKRDAVTKHHLIPRTLHSNKWFEKNFSKQEMSHRTITVCRDCHMAIHDTHSEKDLGRYFNTKDLLLTDEKIINFIRWVSKKS